MKYRALYASSDSQYDSCYKLNEKVEGYMGEGYKPIGSIQVIYENGIYSVFQAMIKED